MSKDEIGRIERLTLREVWKQEPQDFIPWLKDHLDVLAEATGLSLKSATTEQPAGSFRVDLIATADDGEDETTVVIECQYDKTDHDHLGKMLTYLVVKDASSAVWISEDPRPEHVRVIRYLNESSPAKAFYLLKAEAIRIGESPYALLLTPIMGPSEEARQAGRQEREKADRPRLLLEFNTGLLDRARGKTSLHQNITPNSSGESIATWKGVNFKYRVLRADASVVLYIDLANGERNVEIFKALQDRQQEIERDFGEPLDWIPMDGKNACRIEKKRGTGGYMDEDRWEEVWDGLSDDMKKMEKAMKKHLKTLLS